jgi:transposase-like protein
MIDNLIKNARLTSSGRKLLTSQEKAYLVEEWQSSGVSCPEFCRRHGLIASQLYKRSLRDGGKTLKQVQ